jgi:hypothetical protein
MAEYTPIFDPQLQERVRTRYSSDIYSLKNLGFRMLGYCLESLGPFSAIWQSPILLLAWPKKEIIVFRSPLRLGVATPILTHTDPPSLALCMGLGVKIYASFSDGTLLISSNFQSLAVPRVESRIVKPLAFSTIDGAWLAHTNQVAKIQTGGATIRPIHTFDDYVAISKVEEDRSQYQ